MINGRAGGARLRSHSRGRSRVGAKSLRRRGRSTFSARNVLLIIFASVLLAAGIICLVLFTGGNEQAVAQASGSAAPTVVATTTPVPTVNVDEMSGEYNYEGVDPSILAGLAGTDDSLFTDDEETLVTSGIKIGVTLGSIVTEDDKLLLEKMEQASGDAVKKGLVYDVCCYDAKGSYNQQLQDMRSLIKNEVDVIIVGATDAESFDMVSYMAGQAGIPLVAYDAPVHSGFAANVISDQTAWGKAYGDFMAQNLPAGNVAEILGSETNVVDQQRKSAIDASLSTNSGISLLGATYASWNSDTAKEAVSSLIKQSAVDGVITEQGMAAGVLEAFAEQGKLPKVMCGDTTAGFIKKWYALINGGLVIADTAQGKHTPQPKLLTVQPGQIVLCAQPAPGRAAAIAFDIALKLADGRTLISEGAEYTYAAVTFITDENLSYYYEMARDMPDSYCISDPIDAAAAESLFNPAGQQ